MPSKIQLDENLWFLYICLQKSDLKQIDFLAVGEATNLKPPAARMRYTRLRKQIESGTLIGTHGTPFTASPSTGASAVEKEKKEGVKRKRAEGTPMGGEGGSGIKVDVKSDRMVDEKLPVVPERGHPTFMQPTIMDMRMDSKKTFPNLGSPVSLSIGNGVGNKGLENVVKTEYQSTDDETDSEDEMPLAKLRKPMPTASMEKGDIPQSMGREGQLMPKVAGQSMEYVVPQVGFNPAFLSGQVWGAPSRQWMSPGASGYLTENHMNGGGTS